MSLGHHRLSLTLEVERIAGEAPAQPLSARFDEAGGSIGRREDNDWVLPDPQRFISGRHALISFRDGGFVITDVSSNGVFVNQAESPLGNGNSVRLEQGDCLAIGEYEIGVSLRESAEHSAASAGFDSLEDPFARLLDEHAGHRLEPASPPLDGREEGAVDEAAFSLDEPASMDLPGEGQAGPAPAVSGASEPDHISDLNAVYSQSSPIPEDWQEDAGGGAMPRAPVDVHGDIAPLPEPIPAAEPAEGGVGPAPERPAPGPLRPAPAAGTAELRKALAKGLGLSVELLEEAPMQLLLENLGRIVRSNVEGVMSVLRARAQMKSEFRMSQTMIRPVENNPLKFSVNTEEALRHIVDLRMNSGYLPPQAAIREAHEDIEAHMMAVMVGMQSALKAVLLRFKPENLEQRLGQSSLMERVPLYRQAKSWELFNELYGEIANEVEDDFQQLFGRAFTQAYEAQIRRLASLKHTNNDPRQVTSDANN